VREVSFVDPSTQTATITSTNLSLSQFATCTEHIHYAPSPSSSSKTAFSQTAEIEARMAIWRSAADKLESFLAQRFEQNAELGKRAFTDVLQRLWGERAQLQAA
jgi:hypothetical protein